MALEVYLTKFYKMNGIKNLYKNLIKDKKFNKRVEKEVIKTGRMTSFICD